MIQWILHTFGLDDGSGAWYLFWSGIVGDLALAGAIVTAYKIANCHAHGCWRFGLHHVVGTPYRTCRKHHPVVPAKVTAAHIAQVHAGAVADGLAMADEHFAQQTGEGPHSGP